MRTETLKSHGVLIMGVNIFSEENRDDIKVSIDLVASINY